MTCPSSDVLYQFAHGLLDEAQFEEVAMHLEHCDRCTDWFSDLETPNRGQPPSSSAGELDWSESDAVRQLTENLLRRGGPGADELGPEMIGRIRIIRHIASGSYGRVYEGWDEELERRVAIKLPRSGKRLDAETKDRIRQEARLAARLDHPGIVPIYDIGENSEGEIFIVSGFVDGCDLKTWRDTHKPTIDESLRLVAKIADIIQFAHENNLVHRDIKPGNILMDAKGNPHLVDFGLSSQYQTAGERSADGLAGTPAYLPPENLDYVHPPLDPRGDLYSLGVILYELLTGRRPFDLRIENWKETLRHAEPVQPSTRNPAISSRLDRICLRALSKDPQRRHVSAADFAAELRSLLSTTSAQPRTSFWAVRGASVQKLIAVSSAILVAMIGVVLWRTVVSEDNSFADHANTSLLPQLPEGVSLDPVRVKVTTNPPGLRVAIVPLDLFELNSQKDVILPDVATPLEMHLFPGEYIVEVRFDDGSFQHAYRQVIESQSPDELVEWRTITTPASTMLQPDLVTVPEGSYEPLIREFANERLRGRQQIREFQIINREIRYGDYLAIMGGLSSEMSSNGVTEADAEEPLGHVTFHDAAMFAESAGLRLLTAAEFEYVASNGGETRFPWGNRFPRVRDWEQLAELDQTVSKEMPGVSGLFSGSAEWTLSAPLVNKSVGVLPIEVGPQGHSFAHYFYGAPPEIVQGMSLADIRIRPANRRLDRGIFCPAALSEFAQHPRLGVRLGRDVSPRYLGAAQP